MSFSNYGRLRPQVQFLQRQLLQDGKLPFTDVLSESTVEQALKVLSRSLVGTPKNSALLRRTVRPERAKRNLAVS